MSQRMRPWKPSTRKTGCQRAPATRSRGRRPHAASPACSAARAAAPARNRPHAPRGAQPIENRKEPHVHPRINPGTRCRARSRALRVRAVLAQPPSLRGPRRLRSGRPDARAHRGASRSPPRTAPRRRRPRDARRHHRLWLQHGPRPLLRIRPRTSQRRILAGRHDGVGLQPPCRQLRLLPRGMHRRARAARLALRQGRLPRRVGRRLRERRLHGEHDRARRRARQQARPRGLVPRRRLCIRADSQLGREGHAHRRHRAQEHTHHPLPR